MLIDGVDVGTAEVVELSFGCRVTGAEMCTLLRLPDGRIIHWPSPAAGEPVIEDGGRLHDADCPMTNDRRRDRTVCVCDTDGPSGERTLDTPEGTGD